MAQDSQLTIYNVNNNDELEIPLKYNIEYTYLNTPEIADDFIDEVTEKIGNEHAPEYIQPILEETENINRIDPGTGYYNLMDSSIKNVYNEIAKFEDRPLKIAHWSGEFKFIEYFTYNLPDKMFKVILDPDQKILIHEYVFTYKPVFLYED